MRQYPDREAVVADRKDCPELCAGELAGIKCTAFFCPGDISLL